MHRERATNTEWDAYYERAAQIRAITGDPFKKHVRRRTLQERIVLAASAVFMLVAVLALGGHPKPATDGHLKTGHQE
jgi:hypothetical protein